MRLTWCWPVFALILIGCELQPLPSSSPELAVASLSSSGSKPGRVSDLAVTGTTDGSAILSFTEVGDGDDGSANYDIRYAQSVIYWGYAKSVSLGTCATPLAGTAPGARRSCTVAGLETGKRYQFQLVPFRGTLNVNAVFGRLSNVASAEIIAAPGVSSITLSPSSATDTVGKVLAFSATTLDATGNVLSGRVIAWTTSDSSVLSVDANGLVTGKRAGLATVTATSEGAKAVAVTRVVAARPGAVTDLSVVSGTDTSLTVRFTEVAGGDGSPASYDIRVAPNTMSWGTASSVTLGTCASPVAGIAVGSLRTCTIRGLSASSAYAIQLVAFRGSLNGSAVFGSLSNIATGTTAAAAGASPVVECGSPRAGWIWCDDFEQDRTARYFEYDRAGGNFARATSVGYNGSSGMRAHWNAGAVGAGALHLAIGQTPSTFFRPVDAGTARYREVYWRVYVRNQAGWVGGGGDKLTRAFVFSGSNWSQAAIGHVWSGVSEGSTGNNLVLDPVSGTDAAGNLLTTQYNDFAHFTWLGQARSTMTVFDAAHVGQWHCIESHMRLNQAGSSDGLLEVWIDGSLQAQRTGLNFLGAFSQYGINAVYLENYWNAGSAATQERYLDNFVVSTARIGCL